MFGATWHLWSILYSSTRGMLFPEVRMGEVDVMLNKAVSMFKDSILLFFEWLGESFSIGELDDAIGPLKITWTDCQGHLMGGMKDTVYDRYQYWLQNPPDSLGLEVPVSSDAPPTADDATYGVRDNMPKNVNTVFKHQVKLEKQPFLVLIPQLGCGGSDDNPLNIMMRRGSLLTLVGLTSRMTSEEEPPPKQPILPWHTQHPAVPFHDLLGAFQVPGSTTQTAPGPLQAGIGLGVTEGVTPVPPLVSRTVPNTRVHHLPGVKPLPTSVNVHHFFEKTKDVSTTWHQCK
ncbi:hypothetical protein F5141DRAFT_1067660 [Pisolithus sp. B1]|nr:hypothetical protein F5141DRAFT_1067660 [Pisolithus sp. B1]